MQYLLIFLGTVLIFVTPPAGYAGEEKTDRKELLMDTIVVTGESRAPEYKTGDVDTETGPAHFSRIKKEMFEGKIVSLSEVIEKESGVQIRQSGGLGSFSSVSLRGSSADQVMVFLDGILLNDASGGGVDMSNISLSDVESVEIYRGTAPVNFSKSSLGGIVNIRTLRAKEGFMGNISSGYGSFHTRKLSGFLNRKNGPWDYLLSADWLASDNDYDILNDKGTEWNSSDDRREKRNNAETDQYNFLAKAGYDFSPNLRLDMMNQYFSKKQGLPSWDNSAVTRSSLDTDRSISTLKLRADDLGDWHLNTSAQLSYTRKEEEYDDRGGHIGLGDQHSTYTTERLGGDFFLEWLSDYQTLIFSAVFQYENYESEDHLGKDPPLESSRNSFSLGMQDSIFLFQDSLIITPGLRYTWLEDELEDSSSRWDNYLEGDRRRDDYLSPQMGIRYCSLDFLTFKTNLAQYVREPSFFEMFGDRGFFIGNPELKKEKGINFDLGVEMHKKREHTWLRSLTLGLSYFRNSADDLIARVYDARGIGKSVNISGALIQGIEGRMSADIFDYFRLIVNATLQDPENRSDIKAFDGKTLPGHYEKSYLARLEARYRGFKVYAEYLREEDMYYDTANLRKAGDKDEVNGGITWNWQSWQFSLDAKNLSDDLYEDFNGYPLPGRAFYGTVKYEF